LFVVMVSQSIIICLYDHIPHITLQVFLLPGSAREGITRVATCTAVLHKVLLYFTNKTIVHTILTPFFNVVVNTPTLSVLQYFKRCPIHATLNVHVV